MEKQTPFVFIPPAIQNMPLYQYQDSFRFPLVEIDLIKKTEDKKRIYEKIAAKEMISIDSFKTLSLQDVVKVLNHNVDISNDTMKKIALLKILTDTLLTKNKDLKFTTYNYPFKQIAQLYSDIGNKEEAQKYENLYEVLSKDTTNLDYQFSIAVSDIENNRFDDAKKKFFDMVLHYYLGEIVEAFAENKSTHPDCKRMENLLKTTFPDYTIEYFDIQLSQLQDSLPRTFDSLQIYHHFIDTLNLFVKIDSLQKTVYPELKNAYLTQAMLCMALGEIPEAQKATKYYYQIVDSMVAKSLKVERIDLLYATLFKNRTQNVALSFDNYISKEVEEKSNANKYSKGEFQSIMKTMAVFDNEQITKQSDMQRVKSGFESFANLEKVIDEVNESIKNEKDRLKIVSLYSILMDTLLIHFQKDTANNYCKNILIECSATCSQKALLSKQFKVAEKASRIAVQLDSENMAALINLAQALLYQGKYEEAKQRYTALKNDEENAESNIELILSDFDEFESKGIIPKEREADVAAIKRLLEKKE